MRPLSREVAAEVVKLVNAGLTAGIGVPEPGKMCVEAVVCFALGIPHSDAPPCVHRDLVEFKINLNDSAWSNDMSRARGMKRLAVAQLGSLSLDYDKFCDEVAKRFALKYPRFDTEGEHPTEYASSRAIETEDDQALHDLAAVAADVLVEAKTEGAQWMNVCYT